jgi:hypothetical protein
MGQLSAQCTDIVCVLCTLVILVNLMVASCNLMIAFCGSILTLLVMFRFVFLLLLVFAGEAAAASAAATSERDGDSDRVPALGGRILDAATPFVAAAVRRGSQEQQLDLTSRLQQLMLAAARLANRHSVIAGPAVAASSSGGSTGVGTAAAAAGRGAALGQIPEDVSLHPSHARHHLHIHQHGSITARAGVQHNAGRGVGSKLRAGMSRLAARRGLRQQGSGLKGLQAHSILNSKTYRQQRLTGGGSGGRVLHPVLAGSRDSAAYSWGCVADDGLGVAEDLQSQLLVAEAEAVLSGEDLAHPWSWDITQPLTVLSYGIKVRATSHMLWLNMEKPATQDCGGVAAGVAQVCMFACVKGQ